MTGDNSNSYLVSFQGKLPIHLLAHLPKAKDCFLKIETSLVFPTETNELLKKGIYFALLQALLRLVDRHTDPLLEEIVPEYQTLILDIQKAYKDLNPDQNSNWLDECIQYGDKSAYHWIWKHFDSHELF
jgi:hypothetical protein